MKLKEEYIKDIQYYVINFNEYWEDPITSSLLVTNTEEVCNEIIGYCQIINIQLNKYKGPKDYNKYNDIVKTAIKEIIDRVNDGRDLWNPIPMSTDSTKIYDHHVHQNHHLGFENEPRTNNIIEACQKLIELIESERNTIDFQKYENKYLTAEHDENGSYTLYISKIYKKSNGEYAFDGNILYWATVDSLFDYDGLLFSQVEDYPFIKLPMTRIDHNNYDESFKKYLESLKEEEPEKIKEQVYNCINDYLNTYLDI